MGIVAAHVLSSHQYADDTQIYGHCSPEGVPLSVLSCLSIVDLFQRSSRGRHLIVYDSTLTKQRQYGLVLWMQPHWFPNTSIDRCNLPSQTVRSLGVYLDTSLTMGPHVGRTAASCYAKLRVLKEAKPFVPHQIFMSLIIQLIHSKLDYCNSILVNASCRNLNTLQVVMNTAARLIYGGRSSDHITPLHRPVLA